MPWLSFVFSTEFQIRLVGNVNPFSIKPTVMHVKIPERNMNFVSLKSYHTLANRRNLILPDSEIFQNFAGAQLFMSFTIFQCGRNHDGKISFDATRGISTDQNQKCVRFGKYVKKGKRAIKLGQENKKGSNLRLIFECYYEKMSNCQYLWFICHFYVVHFKSEIREEKNSTILDVFNSLEQV